jgi:hypothetical protein
LEIKYGRNKLLPHQKAALLQVRQGAFTYKIPDTGGRRPFDAFVLKDAHSFVVVCKGRHCIAYTPQMEQVFTFICTEQVSSSHSP